jgi:2-keto-4-pentenoate hydratase/2-oxohepta-3-ene-1,7-dioic acid hydratase in catechol pathway
MKVGRFEDAVGRPRLGIVLERGGALWVLNAAAAIEDGGPTGFPSTMSELMAAGRAGLDAGYALAEWAQAQEGADWFTPEPKVRWLVPVPGAYCIAGGRNFAAHRAETAHIAQGASAFHTEFPMGFVKLPGAMVPTRSVVRRPPGVAWFDYEIEACAVIGTRVQDASEKDALRSVFGYTVLNDLSARELQRKEMANQAILLGKNFPGFAPVGPWITTADEIGDPAELELELRVNGDLRQHASCSDLIFGFQAMVAHWSRMGLEPGTLISTGSPEGVAVSRRPDPKPFFLRPGDLVEARVRQVGTLQTRIA